MLPRASDRKKASEILDTIDKYCTGEVRIIATVHTICAVNEALLQGRDFFCSIYNRGVVLYDASGIAFEVPAIRSSPGRLAGLRVHWDRHFGLAGKFLDGALYYINEGSPSLAVFMLHQATEHTYIAVLKACIDYRASMHSLSRLLALTENFSSDLAKVFPQNTEEEIALFKLLACSYSDVRYREGFSVSMEKAKVLCARVKELRRIGAAIFGLNQRALFRVAGF